jgi:hypothetical protein
VDTGERREDPRRHTTRVAVEGGQVEGGTRDDVDGAPLIAHELERLTSVYREDHPGAEIRTTLQVASDVFTITSASSSPCAASLEPLTTAPATTEGTWCTGGAIQRWPTTSATPRGAGKLAGHRQLASGAVQELGISRFLQLII